VREQLGQNARDLHDALPKHGCEQSLFEVAREIPDAQDRLADLGR
jgi:chemotaxis regulatin CheY-phosphate phosphatase CheZ